MSNNFEENSSLKDEQKIWTRIQRRFNKGVVEYGLITDGDRILVGLSGGKDSIVLLRLLAERSRIWKPRFEVRAVHITMENMPYCSDLEYLREYAQSLGVPFHVITTSFDADREPEKSRCFICSWTRRKAMFSLAKELKCNKIALGHHMDDIIETMLMNITFEGNFTTMRPLLKMDKFDMTIVRPLCLVHEADIKAYALQAGFKQQIKVCPFDAKTNRTSMKGMLQQLEAINPEARYSIWHSMTEILRKP